MKYYIRPATPKKNLMLFAVHLSGTEMLERSLDTVTITYVPRKVNLPEGSVELTLSEFSEHRQKAMEVIQEISTQLSYELLKDMYSPTGLEIFKS